MIEAKIRYLPSIEWDLDESRSCYVGRDRSGNHVPYRIEPVWADPDSIQPNELLGDEPVFVLQRPHAEGDLWEASLATCKFVAEVLHRFGTFGGQGKE